MQGKRWFCEDRVELCGLKKGVPGGEGIGGHTTNKREVVIRISSRNDMLVDRVFLAKIKSVQSWITSWQQISVGFYLGQVNGFM